jgi:hypothetical protein
MTANFYTDRWTDERTYRHDQANSRFSKCFERDWKTRYYSQCCSCFPRIALSVCLVLQNYFLDSVSLLLLIIYFFLIFVHLLTTLFPLCFLAGRIITQVFSPYCPVSPQCTQLPSARIARFPRNAPTYLQPVLPGFPSIHPTTFSPYCPVSPQCIQLPSACIARFPRNASNYLQPVLPGFPAMHPTTFSLYCPVSPQCTQLPSARIARFPRNAPNYL